MWLGEQRGGSCGGARGVAGGGGSPVGVSSNTPGHLSSPEHGFGLGALSFLSFLSFSLSLPPPFTLPFKNFLFIMKNVKHTQTQMG